MSTATHRPVAKATPDNLLRLAPVKSIVRPDGSCAMVYQVVRLRPSPRTMDDLTTIDLDLARKLEHSDPIQVTVEASSLTPFGRQHAFVARTEWGTKNADGSVELASDQEIISRLIPMCKMLRPEEGYETFAWTTLRGRPQAILMKGRESVSFSLGPGPPETATN